MTGAWSRRTKKGSQTPIQWTLTEHLLVEALCLVSRPYHLLSILLGRGLLTPAPSLYMLLGYYRVNLVIHIEVINSGL